MQNFLVVSYDDDQQQWFYDTVRADDAGDAQEKICALRPYVMGADAMDVETLQEMAKNVAGAKAEGIRIHLEGIARESGVEFSEAE